MENRLLYIQKRYSQESILLVYLREAGQKNKVSCDKESKLKTTIGRWSDIP